MAKAKKAPPEQEARYRIGAVCRLTGLSPHVLRVWEKRYGVVKPQRQKNRRRLYTDDDVKKLTLLRSLVDHNQAIGTVAGLSMGELERRVEQLPGIVDAATSVEKPKLVLLGESLKSGLEQLDSSEIFELVGAYEEAADLKRLGQKPDVAVIEWPTLHPGSGLEAHRLASRLGVRLLVLMYNYASRSVLSEFSGVHVTAIRTPPDLAVLEALIARRFGFRAPHNRESAHGGTAVAARAFSDGQLESIAQQSSTVACECPRHLAQLVSELVRFEAYSAECESRVKEDAELHQYLHRTTARVRSDMEAALRRVAEMEGLTIIDE